MISKKICMVGAYAVGKTSLVAQFVTSMFSDKYLTTVGVKIDKKSLSVDDQQVNLMLWDVAGEDECQNFKLTYLRGAAGYLLVADLTRAATLEIAQSLQARAHDLAGELPFILLLNKSDLTDRRQIPADALAALREKGWQILETSAKTGANVDAAFEQLTRKMLA